MRKPNERAVLLALGAVAAVALVLITIVKSDGGSDEGDRSQAERQVAAEPIESEKSKRQKQQTETQRPEKKQSEKPSAPSAPEIVVRGGEPVDGIADLDADAGEEVQFQVTSDVADEVHIHGYDLSKPVAAGGSVSFDFVADIEGIFEIELEERAVQIAELQVNP